MDRTCSELGMIANNQTNDSTNYTLLCNALNEGYKILVDGKYYLSCNNASYTVGTDVTKDINIEGITTDAEICLTNTVDRYFIEVQGNNLIMKSVRFTVLLTGNDYAWAFTIRDGHKMDKVIIENCYFSGHLRLLTWAFTNYTYINPEVTNYGITEFKFNFNKCENIKNRYNGFIFFDSVPITYAELVHNNINNFTMIFYSNGVQNADTGNLYQLQQAERMAYLKVADNLVINNLNWDGIPSPLTNSYHCFILFEGNRCEYLNNRVEGLHAFDVSNMGLYDAYLSCWDLLYEGNYWKNNIHFKADKDYNDLMKSKSYNKSSYLDTKRVYRNNTFIVEEPYCADINTANSLSRTLDELWVNLVWFQAELESVWIEGNTVDVYELRMTYDQEIHHYYFLNNYIHTYKMKDAANCILPMHTLTTSDTLAKYIARNNTFMVDTADADNNDFGYNYLIHPIGSANEVKTAKVIFENNYIDWPNLAGFIGNNVSSNIQILTDVRMVGNKIIATRPGTSSEKILQTTQYCVLRKAEFENKVDLSSITTGFLINSTPKGGHQSLDLKLQLKAFPVHSTKALLSLAYNDIKELLGTTAYHNRVTLRCFHSLGEENISFDLKHYYDSGISTLVNIVSFKNSNDITIIQALDGSGTNDGTIVKLTNTGTSSKFIIYFKNTVNDRGFYLHDDIDNTEYCTYELTVRQSKVG
ncbi:hypothetical protein [Dehalobacter sp.]|uniref:hypothetical protein n=1 Tax=Dehalobacter sp. TaxID=1962289 RepID=UPI00258E2523|nr:hypothetical protein [Dehalobacter sp.]MCG1024380.1 hypothetical protein [Dehalobacter sp.]